MAIIPFKDTELNRDKSTYHRSTFKPVQWIGEGVYLKLNILEFIYPRDNRATRENDRKSYKGNLREQ